MVVENSKAANLMKTLEFNFSSSPNRAGSLARYKDQASSSGTVDRLIRLPARARAAGCGRRHRFVFMERTRGGLFYKRDAWGRDDPLDKY